MTTDTTPIPAALGGTDENGVPAIAVEAAPVVVTPPAADTVYEHEQTGNPALDVALDFIGQRGLSPDDEAVIAARKGEFTLIAEKLKAMGDKAKGYEKHLALVKGVYEQETAAAKANVAEIQKAVDGAVGGNARWQAIAAWAGQEATPAQKAQVNAALSAGGMAAAAVARELARQYDAKVGRKDAPAAAADSAAPPPADAAPITAREYGRRVSEMMNKSRGRDITGTAEYKALGAARNAARAAGVK